MIARRRDIPIGRARRRRGTALIEFVMSVPLLGLIIMLTFFFGWSLMNQQHVKASSRYTAWRRVTAGSGVGAGGLNDRFFHQETDEPWEIIGVGGGSGPVETLEELVDVAGDYGPSTDELADRLVLGQFPRGQSAEVSVRFLTTVTSWRRFAGAIRHRYTREGVAWRRRQARCEGAIRELFLLDLDDTLTNIPSPGENFGRAFRRLYNSAW